MVTVEKISEGIRKEGLNYGLPMVFLKLGAGVPYLSVENLVRDMLMYTRCKWVCIFGEGTTQVGMGTLVKGLSSVGMYIEVECSALVRDPGWLHSVDRWIIDYVEEPLFNYAALRSQDMVRFTTHNVSDLDLIKRGFESLRLFPGTKYVKVVSDIPGLFEFVRKYERSRIYVTGE